jgi:hypothetical protein
MISVVNETDNATSNIHRTAEPLLLRRAAYCFRFFREHSAAFSQYLWRSDRCDRRLALACGKLWGFSPKSEASVALTLLYYRFLAMQKEYIYRTFQLNHVRVRRRRLDSKKRQFCSTLLSVSVSGKARHRWMDGESLCGT